MHDRHNRHTGGWSRICGAPVLTPPGRKPGANRVAPGGAARDSARATRHPCLHPGLTRTATPGGSRRDLPLQQQIAFASWEAATG
jgi:hypothetical protein